MATYLRASIPRQFTILGQKMEPFSVWHMEVLMRFENSFVTGSAEIGLPDLVHGVFFCCQNYAEGKAALADPKLEKKLAKWGEVCGKDLWGVEKGKIKLRFREKAVLFAEYLREGSGRPELMPSTEETGESRVPGAPLLLLLRIFLMREMRLTHEEAMNYPFALACHEYFAWHEQNGAAKIANSEELEKLSEHEEAADSEEMLQKCLEALPGSRPIGEQTRPPAKRKRPSVKQKVRITKRRRA